MKTVYLSLGSNVGDREANLQAALDRLGPAGVHVSRVSPTYETEPMEYTAQRWFLNRVAEAETDLFPVQLLSRLQRIERDLGRVRTVDKGPRTIDLDILLYGQAMVRLPELEIPHRRLAERKFVLAPLADLAPDLRHPATRMTVREMLDAVAEQVVKKR